MSGAAMTPERLDEVIAQAEDCQRNAAGDTDYVESFWTDTLAALRAYREAIDTIEVIEQTVETQRAHISLLREQLESAMSHACDCNCTCWEQEFQSWPHLIAHMRGATAPTEAQETRSAESKAECPECFGEGAIPMSNGYERRTCGYCKGFGVIDVHP